MSPPRRLVLVVLVALGLGGCATSGPGRPTASDAATPPEFAGAPSLLEVHDRLEPMKRAIYRFN